MLAFSMHYYFCVSIFHAHISETFLTRDGFLMVSCGLNELLASVFVCSHGLMDLSQCRVSYKLPSTSWLFIGKCKSNCNFSSGHWRQLKRVVFIYLHIQKSNLLQKINLVSMVFEYLICFLQKKTTLTRKVVISCFKVNL